MPEQPVCLFISYGRQDDEPFAKRLCRDLTNLYGFDAWWDREAMRNRGQTFLQEIRDAIFSVDFLILVVGPHAAQSDYVRDEWQHALHFNKIVIAVLRVGLGDHDDVADYALIPEPLRDFHCYDFRDDASYGKNLERLADNIRQGPVELGSLLGVPALPPHYLPRPANLAAVGNFVLADVHEPTVITSERQAVALQGMGGIGKSVIATAFARAVGTRRAFPDGVLWVTVGQKPIVRALLQQAGLALNDSPVNYNDEVTGRASLQKLLANKTCLLVLDDVWDIQAVRPFCDAVSETRCRLLLTTRMLDIARRLDACEHRVGLLTLEQAVTLLHEWTDRIDPELETIAKRLGGLPLALKITGARLRLGMSGTDWLHLYDNRISHLQEVRRPTERDESLEISLEFGVDAVLSDCEKPLYYALGLFKRNVPIPDAIVLKLWEQLYPELDNREANELLVGLVNGALLERNDAEGTLTLHDLLHAYACEKLGDRYIAAHEALLTAFNPDGLPWHRIPPDDYVYDHLAYHLHEAGHHDELYSLLTVSPDWMQTKSNAFTGDASYIADLELALTDFSDPLETTALLNVGRLHAARQAVQARTSFFSDTVLEALVLLGREDEALNYARQRSDATNRFSGLMSIYSLVPEKYPTLLTEIHALAKIIEDTEGRSRRLWSLGKTLTAAGREPEARRVLQEAGQAARQIAASESRGRIMAVVAIAQCKAGAFQKAEQLALDIELPESRAWALAETAQALATAGHQTKARRVLKIAEDVSRPVQYSSSRAKALGEVAEGLINVNAFDDAERVARSIDGSEQRDWALSKLATAFAANAEFAAASRITGEIEDDLTRTRSLVDLARALMQAGRRSEARHILATAQQVANNVKGYSPHDDALKAVAKGLVIIGDFAKAKRVAGQITGLQSSSWVFIEMTNELVQLGHLKEAERSANSVRDPKQRTRALNSLVRSFNKTGQHDEAVRVLAELESLAYSLDGDWCRATLVTVVEGLLAANETAKAERIALDLVENRFDPGVLDMFEQGSAATLARKLAENGCLTTAGRIITTIEQRGATSVLTRRKSLVRRELAQALARAGAHTAAERVARSIHDRSDQEKALREIAREMAKTMSFSEAERVARSIDFEWDRIGALVDIARAMYDTDHNSSSHTLLADAEQMVNEGKPDWSQAHPLLDLIRGLVDIGDFKEAERVANQIKDDQRSAEAFATIGQALAENGSKLDAQRLFKAAEKRAEEEESQSGRDSAFAVIARKLAAVGVFTEAKRVAQRMQKANDQRWVLKDLVKALVEAGDLAEAERIATGMEPDALWTIRSAALAIIVQTLVAREELVEAQRVTDQIEDPRHRAASLALIAQTLATFDQRKALLLFKVAKETALESGWGGKTDALIDVACALKAAEYQEEAARVFISAEKAAQAHPNDTYSSLNSQAVVKAQAAQGEYDAAVSSARRIADQDSREWALGKIAIELANAGQIAQAFQELGVPDISKYIRILVECQPAFDRVVPGLTVDVLREVIRIIGWTRTDWREVYEMLADEAGPQAARSVL